MPKELVKIGSKPTEKYRQAILYAVNNFGECKIRALGKRQEKADELLEYASSFDGLEIEYKRIISVNGTYGIEAKIAVIEDGG